MGTWEVGIYQNDLSADVKDDYISKLKAGKSDEQALAEMLDEYKEEADDIDCKCDLFIALAGIMWDKGRLTEEIKQRALAEIEEDKTAERWEGEKIRQKRCIELEKFKEKLESEMPPRKKVPVHRPYKAGWIEGGVYCFQITETIDGYEEYTGWYATFYVDMELGKSDEKLNIENTDTMNNKGIKICDECGSEFLVGSSKMMGLCPECASVLYGYENCKHIFHQGRCVKCLWKGNKSEYVKRLEDFK